MTATPSRRDQESLTSAIRAAYKRAYRKGIKESEKAASYVYEEIADWRTRTNTLVVWLAYIKRLGVTKRKAKQTPDNPERQLHLWDDLDELYPIQRPPRINAKTGEVVEEAHTDLIQLGDFGLTEIEQHDRQIDDNLKAINDERNIWRRAKRFVIPLLKDHPGWKWRDAVEHMREHDELPDLAPESEPVS